MSICRVLGRCAEWCVYLRLAYAMRAIQANLYTTWCRGVRCRIVNDECDVVGFSLGGCMDAVAGVGLRGVLYL